MEFAMSLRKISNRLCSDAKLPDAIKDYRAKIFEILPPQTIESMSEIPEGYFDTRQGKSGVRCGVRSEDLSVYRCYKLMRSMAK